MKLATYKDGSRDGQLVVVSRDLTSAHYASGIATRVQKLLDDWNFLSPQLEDLATSLNQGKARHAFAFDPRLCAAPLPRVFQRATRVAALPDNGALLVMMPGSDELLGAHDDMVCPSEQVGIEVGAGLAVATGDVAMGSDAGTALEGIRLVMLVGEVSLQNLASPAQRHPATVCSPVAVTPDELGQAWQGGRVHLNLEAAWNGKAAGPCDAAAAMGFHFGELIAHLCTTRRVRAGALIGSGALSSAGPMHCGDRVRIETKGRDGMSVFGAIEQRVRAPD